MIDEELEFVSPYRELISELPSLDVMDSIVGDYISPPFPVDFDNFFTVPTEKVKERRQRRKKLTTVRLLLSKFLLIISLSTIIIMMTNVQLTLMRIYDVCSQEAIILKATVSSLTGVLIVLVWVYNYIQLELFRNIRNIESFRIAAQVNPYRGFLVFLETLLNLPHPLPWCTGHSLAPIIEPTEAFVKDYSTTFEVVNNETSAAASNYSSQVINTGVFTDNKNISEMFHHSVVRLTTIDSVLSVLMFLRLYHIARFTVLHSKLFRTMLSYSLGALAHTKYNFSFIFKSYMAIYKGYFLAALALTFTALAAWCIYICDKEIHKYPDALWVVGITFFTVGK